MTTTDDLGTGIPVRSGYNYEHDEAFATRGQQRWVELREEHGPAFRSDVMPEWDVWYLLEDEDIRAALQQHETFSSRAINAHSPIGEVTMIPEMLDPPEHGKYRHLLAPWFAPAAVKAREPEIRALCVQLIERLADLGSCDLDADFARLFPTTVFLRWMGLDEDEVNELVPKAYEMFQRSARAEGDAAEAMAGMSFVMEHLIALVEDRKVNPRDDLVTALVQAQIDGAPIDDDKVFPILFLLYIAGLDTVAGELTYTFRVLAEHPELQRRVREQPEAIPAFIEEVLRLHGLATTARLVAEDVTFAGCPMHAGDRVVLPTAAANLDPKMFPEPETLVPDREANRHITFGAGPHRCLGSHLARLEMAVAVEEWHRRIPTYRLRDGVELRHKLGSVTGLLSLPIDWS